jgi:hypothetical protein
MTDFSTQALYAEAVLGKDAEEFLKSDIGRIMLARAEEEESEALEALAGVSSWWRARSFKQWLTELVVTGRQALQQLETPED